MSATNLLLGRRAEGKRLAASETGWLQRSREALPQLRRHPFADRVPAALNPVAWAIVVTAATAWVVFVVFW